MADSWRMLKLATVSPLPPQEYPTLSACHAALKPRMPLRFAAAAPGFARPAAMPPGTATPLRTGMRAGARAGAALAASGSGSSSVQRSRSTLMWNHCSGPARWRAHPSVKHALDSSSCAWPSSWRPSKAHHSKGLARLKASSAWTTQPRQLLSRLQEV